MLSLIPVFLILHSQTARKPIRRPGTSFVNR
nr:MAG TPA: hypothetical protein [Herelleviridae sp.]